MPEEDENCLSHPLDFETMDYCPCVTMLEACLILVELVAFGPSLYLKHLGFLAEELHIVIK